MKKMFLSLIVMVFGAGVLNANMMIAPTKMEAKLDRTRTESFILVNKYKEPAKIEILAVPENNFVSVPLIKDGFAKYDLSPYMKVSPKVVKLQPEKGRTIRVSVVPTKELKAEPGDYVARVLFKTLERNLTPKKQKEKAETVSMKINFLFNVTIPAYGTVGSGQPALKAYCFTENKKPVVGLINTAAFRYEGNAEFYNVSDDTTKVKKLFTTDMSVFREASRTYEVESKGALNKNEKYTLKLVHGTDPKTQKAYTFTCSFKDSKNAFLEAVEKAGEELKAKKVKKS